MAAANSDPRPVRIEKRILTPTIPVKIQLITKHIHPFLEPMQWQV